MNLQSNALKFTKDGGKIRIICEFIRGIYDKNNRKKPYKSKLKKIFLQEFSSGMNSSNDDTSNSETKKFEK